MIGGQGAFDRFCADIEREAMLTPAAQWLERNSAAIDAMRRERLADEVREQGESK